MSRTTCAAALSLLLTAAGPASSAGPDEPHDHPHSTPVVDEIEVTERSDDLIGIAISGAEGVTGLGDLQRRPVLRSGDLVETVPGMVSSQHSGGGKANQYYVRGFNLDHGTDFLVTVDGVPVNLPSHGHGQGYADLNFLIPELVERARYRKGPYYSQVGDFSAAGSLNFDLLDEVSQGSIQLTGGSFDYGRALWTDSFHVGDDGHLLLALDAFHDDGPFTRGDDYDGTRFMARWSKGDHANGFRITALGYDADWLSTDQIPRRLVEASELGRFDLLDPGPRGDTRRLNLSAHGHRTRGNSTDHLQVYAYDYDFSLVSNFTYFLEDPEGGDQFQQLDSRRGYGFQLSRTWFGDGNIGSWQFEAGLGSRYDDIDNALQPSQLVNGEIITTGTVRDDTVEVLTGGPFVDYRMRVNDWFRFSAGLRYDIWTADVTAFRPVNSGSADDQLLSPKLSLAFGPWNDTEFYVNAGRGFHSNDARGATVVIDPLSSEAVDQVDPLVRVDGFDVGFRSSAIPRLSTAWTVFHLELDSELVFVGDAGATEAGPPSRRWGIEVTNTYSFTPSLRGELDVTWADAEFREVAPGETDIPGAVGRTVGAGLSWQQDAWSAGLRWRYFGDIPLIEDGSAVWSSSSVLNGQIGYEFDSGLSVRLEAFNLLDREDSDVEYFYASRLRGEPAEGVEDVHFHPMIERSFRLVVGWRY